VADPTDELYAPPRSERGTPVTARSKIASVVVVVGLSTYAVLQLVSAPLAIESSARLGHLVYLKLLGAGLEAGELARADLAYSEASAFFFLIRALSEVGMMIGYVAGLVWLYQAWAATNSGKQALKVSPRGVVLWSFVPVWGVLRLHEFLLRIARACDVRPESLYLGLWVSALFLQIGVRLTSAGRIGEIVIVDAIVSTVASLLGIWVVVRLQRGLDERAARKARRTAK
jgi:hypothetical protein